MTRTAPASSALVLALVLAFASSAFAADPACSDYDQAYVVDGEVWIDVAGLAETAQNQDEPGALDIAKTVVDGAGHGDLFVHGEKSAAALVDRFGKAGSSYDRNARRAARKVKAVIGEVVALADALAADYEGLQPELDEVEQKLAFADEYIADLNAELDAADPDDKKLVDQIIDDIEDARAKRAAFQAEFDALNAKAGVLERDVAKADEGIDSMKAMVCQLAQ